MNRFNMMDSPHKLWLLLDFSCKLLDMREDLLQYYSLLRSCATVVQMAPSFLS
jgi:hypothetical protein